MSSCSRGLRFLAAALATTMVAACTLVSGWTDLQGGQVDGGGRPTTSDDATTSERDGASDGSAPAADSSAPPEGVPCGAQTCTGQTGCCISLGQGTRSCTDRTTCNAGATRRFLLCAHSGQCPGDRPNCCLGFDEWDSTCENGCPAGAEVLCDPAQVAKHCQAGEACLQYSATKDLNTCQ